MLLSHYWVIQKKTLLVIHFTIIMFCENVQVKKTSSSKNNYTLKLDVQSNSVITNSSGPTKLVRYNRVFVITGLFYVAKWPFGPQNLFVITEFVITEFVITEFHCNCFFKEQKKSHDTVLPWRHICTTLNTLLPLECLVNGPKEPVLAVSLIEFRPNAFWIGFNLESQLYLILEIDRIWP